MRAPDDREGAIVRALWDSLFVDPDRAKRFGGYSVTPRSSHEPSTKQQRFGLRLVPAQNDLASRFGADLPSPA